MAGDDHDHHDHHDDCDHHDEKKSTFHRLGKKLHWNVFPTEINMFSCIENCIGMSIQRKATCFLAKVGGEGASNEGGIESRYRCTTTTLSVLSSCVL